MQAEFITDAALKNFQPGLSERDLPALLCSDKMTSYFQQSYSLRSCGTSWMPKSLSELFH